MLLEHQSCKRGRTHTTMDIMTNHAQTESSGVLDGIVVADFSRVLAGPYATMMLADMGATVIKVESPGGDDTRAWQPPVRDDQSTYFLSVNRNKQAIALDLKADDDLATAHTLLAKADVFIENFKPGGLTKFNMDPNTVAQRYPHLVHASITGFGTTGGAHLPGYDLLAQAASGLMDITGDPAADGQKAGVAIFDVVTGLHATVGILGALQEREHSGKGQHIAVNLMSSALSGLVNQTSAYAAGGVVPTRMGNDHPSLAPYVPFAASDQPLIIAVGNDGQFVRLATALGAEHLAKDERYATNPARNQHRNNFALNLSIICSTTPQAGGLKNCVKPVSPVRRCSRLPRVWNLPARLVLILCNLPGMSRSPRSNIRWSIHAAKSPMTKHHPNSMRTPRKSWIGSTLIPHHILEGLHSYDQDN